MLAHVETAIRALIAADPSITPEMADEAMAALRGESVASVAVAMPSDRALSRTQVAAILGVKPHTVSDYARQGKIVAFRFGSSKRKAMGYSAESVKRLMAS